MIYAGIHKNERFEKAKILLKQVGLEDRMDHTSSQLSGGQMQRVAIARALAMNPSIILADEPTGNVSSAQSDEIMKLFQNLQKQGHTIIMITHEPSVAAYAQRIIHVKDGKIEKDETNKKGNRK
jgi:putative ABC transport system ATP-binding protein